MASLHDSLNALYRKLLGLHDTQPIQDRMLLQGGSAITLAEAAMAEILVAAPSFTGQIEQTFWHQLVETLKAEDTELRADATESPRSSLTSAMGLALTGHRTSVFLSAEDAASAVDLIRRSAELHLPLTLHLVNDRAGTIDHHVYHQLVDSGCLLMLAGNLQQALDFSLIGRMVAETALLPAVIAVDRDTCQNWQEVVLPAPQQLQQLIGNATDLIHVPDTAQRLLFGRERRRIPIWHDLDQPILLGNTGLPETLHLAAESQRLFFEQDLKVRLAEACNQFAEFTGRQPQLVQTSHLKGAKLIFVSQGSLSEAATTATALLRKQGLAVGTVSIQSLRPVPEDELKQVLGHADTVLVLERSVSGLHDLGPLGRELSVLLPSSISCHSISTGGAEIALSNLIDLANGYIKANSTSQSIGVQLKRDETHHPKREVLVETLTRAYPDAVDRYLNSPAQTKTEARVICFKGVKDVGSLAAAIYEGSQQKYVRLTATEQVYTLCLADALDQLPGADRHIDVMVVGERPTSTAKALKAQTDNSTRFLFLTEAAVKHFPDPDSEYGYLMQEDGDPVASILALLNGDTKQFDVAPKTEARELSWQGEVPAQLIPLASHRDVQHSLPRHWDQHGVFYFNDETDELTLDPYLAAGTAAPLTSVLHPPAAAEDVPVLIAEQCTGCGECWANCPDGAISAVAVTPRKLVEQGIRATGASALAQITGQLASRISTDAKSRELPATAGTAIQSAGNWVLEQMQLPPERLEKLQPALDQLSTHYDSLTVIATDSLFDQAEAGKRDSGELLSLAINPDRCKGCQLCISQCEPLALVSGPAELKLVQEQWQKLTLIDDTAAATVERLLEDANYPPVAAVGLSGPCAQSMSGGDTLEPGSGLKLALRQILSLAELHGQQQLNHLAHDLEHTKQQLMQMVQQKLTDTVAAQDLGRLHEALEVQDGKPNLSAVVSELARSQPDQPVSTEHFGQAVHSAEALQQDLFNITQGNHGLGRARYSLVLEPDCMDIRYPYNPFSVPATINSDPLQLAAGIAQGHIRDCTDQLTRLRQAQQLLGSDPSDRIHWRDLATADKRTCPPVIVVADDHHLAGQGLSQLLWLLSSELPVKVIGLTGLDLHLSVDDPHDPLSHLALLALTCRNAYVSQTSIAHGTHLYNSVREALRYPGPAFISVYAPSPSEHGFATDQLLTLAEAAVNTRIFPLFSYDPHAPGVHGARLSLAGNPDLKADWVHQDDNVLLPAGWFELQMRYSDLFSDEAMRVQTAKIASVWQMLQELAGEQTPFTEKVWQSARAETEAEHQVALNELNAEHKNEIANLRATIEAEIAARIRQQLVKLAQSAPAGSQSHVE